MDHAWDSIVVFPPDTGTPKGICVYRLARAIPEGRRAISHAAPCGRYAHLSGHELGPLRAPSHNDICVIDKPFIVAGHLDESHRDKESYGFDARVRDSLISC